MQDMISSEHMTKRLQVLKKLRWIQSQLGGVVLAREKDEVSGRSYASYRDILRDVQPFIFASGCLLYQRVAAVPVLKIGGSGDAVLRTLITELIDLESGEMISEEREIQLLGGISLEDISKAETIAKRSAIKTLFCVHDDAEVPSIDHDQLVQERKAAVESVRERAQANALAERIHEMARLDDDVRDETLLAVFNTIKNPENRMVIYGAYLDELNNLKKKTKITEAFVRTGVEQ